MSAADELQGGILPRIFEKFERLLRHVGRGVIQGAQ